MDAVASVIPSRVYFQHAMIYFATGSRIDIKNDAELKRSFAALLSGLSSNIEAQLIDNLLPRSEEIEVNFLPMCAGIVHYLPTLITNQMCDPDECRRHKAVLLIRCFISHLIMHKHSLSAVFEWQSNATHVNSKNVLWQLHKRHRDSHQAIRERYLEIAQLLLLLPANQLDASIQHSVLGRVLWTAQNDNSTLLRLKSLQILATLFEVDREDLLYTLDVFQSLASLCLNEHNIRVRMQAQCTSYEIYLTMMQRYPRPEYNFSEVDRLGSVLVTRYQCTPHLVEKQQLTEILQHLLRFHQKE